MATVSTVRKGSTGADVTKLQESLVALGYNITVDGIFGAKTDAALKEYQTAHGLEPDGVCGASTWAVIQSTEPSETTPTLEERVAALEGKVAELESK